MFMSLLTVFAYSFVAATAVLLTASFLSDRISVKYALLTGAVVAAGVVVGNIARGTV
ncbi:hypothetical protein [Halorubrum gandharaense]